MPAIPAKMAFLSHLYIKTIILPRQARDKHRENSKKDAVFRTEHCGCEIDLHASLVKRFPYVCAAPVLVK